MLPPELCILILQLLDHADRRNCLCLNRAWHDSAVPLVFEYINIYCGNWNAVDGSTYFDVMSADMEELLQYLSEWSLLSNSVRKMTVYHYTSNGPPAYLWYKIFSSLSNLESFQWLGHCPLFSIFPKDISQVCPRLVELRVPSGFPMPFPCISNLKILQLGRVPFIDSPEAYFAKRTAFGTPDQWPDWQTIHNNIQNVQILTATACNFLFISHSWFNPRILDKNISLLADSVEPTLMTALRSSGLWYTNLVSLDILALERTVISTQVMAELRNIQHLALQGIETPNFISNLQNWTSTVLPSLRSFKLISKYLQHSPAEYEAISAFLRAHPYLRRLDLDVIGSWHVISEHLLPVIRPGVLDALEVLGLNIGLYMDPMNAWLANLGQSLRGQQLKALRLAFWWTKTRWPSPYMLSILDSLATIQDLRFLYVSRGFDQRVFTESNILSRLEHIKCFGLDENVWSVRFDERYGSSASITPALDKWPKGKVMRRMAEDFVDEDYEWLLRHYKIG